MEIPNAASIQGSSESSAPESSTSDAASEASPPVVLKWSTASELECYGYHVYRGPSADGPFERLTDEVIPGGGTSHEVRSYRFEDNDPLPTGTYFYFVEEIGMDGSSRPLTPPRPFDV